MAVGGFAQLPDGSVIVALSLPSPGAGAAPAPGTSAAATGGPPGPAPGAAPPGADPRTVAAAPHARGDRRTAPVPWPAGPGATAAPQGAPAPWRHRLSPDDPWAPERRRWSAHADAARTVRAAAPRTGVLAAPEEPCVRVLVHAGNRARALTRLRNLGLRAVYLRGNTQPPTPDEITAVLHHPDGLVWRARPGDETEAWHPIGTLLRHHHAHASRAPGARPAGG